jgi:hypothetical protein
MAHPEQATFCLSVKKKYPVYFKAMADFGTTEVLDVGSLDINGNNRYLWEGPYNYTGIDVGEGKNVDIVCKGHEFRPGKQYDVVISTECFEHDMHWKETISNCIDLTKSGGLFMFTCATTGRQEHGTTRTTPQDSPFTHSLFNDYYKNLTEEDIRSAIDLDEHFTHYEFSTNNHTKDLYFYGIKK